MEYKQWGSVELGTQSGRASNGFEEGSTTVSYPVTIKHVFIGQVSCNDTAAGNGNGETVHFGDILTSKIQLYYNTPVASKVNVYWMIIGL